MKRTAVLGIGNILMSDDGIGVRVVQKLEEKSSLPQVELVDGGSSTMDMLGLFLTCDRIIVVDSLRGGHPPGTVYRITPAELGSYSNGFNVSLHDVQILDLVRISAMLGKSPEVTIIGIEPEEICESMELSPGLEASLPRLIELVEAEASKMMSK